MVDQFRVIAFGKPRAPWRLSREAAIDDAVALGLASWDQSKREWFVPVPADIERRRLPDAPVTPRTDRSHQPWSTDDIDRLRILTTKGEDIGIIALRLGRTRHAVRAKARDLSMTAVASRK